MGEFLKNAQGEDVVAGVRTPMPIAQMEQEFPEAYTEFSCMGGHTAADGQDTLSNLHTGDILRGGLKTHKNNLLAPAGPGLCILSRYAGYGVYG